MKTGNKFLIFLISVIFVLHSIRLYGEDPSALMQTYMQRLEMSGFSGTILVARDGKILLQKGYGMADRENKIQVGLDTVFTVGSITKQFTAAAILKMRMQGKLGLQDRLDKYFPGAPADKAGITIHQLLTHTAGFPEVLGDDFVPVTANEFVDLAMKCRLLHPSGKEYLYSNVGYSLLGIILERISGMGYEEFLSRFLFQPAGMDSTGYKLPEWDKGKLAHGYRQGQDWGTLIDRAWAGDGPGWHLRANGGIMSTLADMYRWHQALTGDRILDASSKKLMYTPHVAENPEGDSHYGYGWALFTTPRSTRLVAHNGGNGIFAADFLRYIDEGVVIIAFSNTAGKPAWKASEAVARILFGEPVAMPLERVVDFDRETLTASPFGPAAESLIKVLGKTEKEAAVFIASYLSEDIPREKRARWLEILQQKNGLIGRVEFVSARQKEEDSLELLLRSRSDGRLWYVTLRFQQGRVAGLMIEPGENGM